MNKAMNKRINFEDNIFILELRIRVIQDMLALDPDPELFLDKTMDDIDFIDYALGTLLGNLIENTLLLEREEEFDSLHDLELLFGSVLLQLFEGGQAISSDAFPVIKNKITSLRISSTERRKTIDKNAGSREQPRSDPVVSSVELSELLKDF
jgi:hypothetical protein